MGFLSKIFGTSKVIESGLNLIDKAFYTDQEKAEEKRLLLKSYEPFKVAQRMLAIMFCGTFLALLTGLFIASFWIDIQPQLTAIESYMSSKFVQPISIILGFYFAGGAMEGIFERMKKK